METIRPVDTSPRFPRECGTPRTIHRIVDSDDSCDNPEYARYILYLRGPEATAEWYPGYLSLSIYFPNPDPAQNTVYPWPYLRDLVMMTEHADEAERLLACAYAHGIRAPIKVTFCAPRDRPTAIEVMAKFGSRRMNVMGWIDQPILGSEALEIHDADTGEIVRFEPVSWENGGHLYRGLHFTHTPPFIGQQPL